MKYTVYSNYFIIFNPSLNIRIIYDIYTEYAE